MDKRQQAIEMFKRHLQDWFPTEEEAPQASNYISLDMSQRRAEFLYTQLAALFEFPEEEHRKALNKIKGPGAVLGQYWSTTGQEEALTDLKSDWPFQQDQPKGNYPMYEENVGLYPDTQDEMNRLASQGLAQVRGGLSSEEQMARGHKPKGGCPTCKGTGAVPDYNSVNDAHRPDPTKDCPDCDGTGERRKGEKRGVDRRGLTSPYTGRRRYDSFGYHHSNLNYDRRKEER